MSEADRIAELEQRLAALEGRTASIDRCERELLEAARQWARVKRLGHYIEDGCIVRLNASDADRHSEHLLSRMRSAALDLLDVEAKPR